MKRLYLVGLSKDRKKLVFAQKKGAKFGSLELPVGPKLLRLVEEVQEARQPKRSPEPPPAEETVPAAAASDAPPEERGERELGAPAPIGLVASDQIDIPIPPGGREEAVDEPLPGIAPAHQNHPSVGLAEPTEGRDATVSNIPRIRPRTEKPEIPARSKLTPAEIQALIRSGRGIRAVANLAGTPMDWVRYLAEPIQEERRGIVRQMLSRRQERARLGLSGVTIGEAILENLRSRGIRSPEEVIEDGFTAFRPDGREWRVRLVFDHRGRRQIANWSFDAQTRQVTPLNSLATSLGWRRSQQADGEAPSPSTRARRSTSRSRGRTVKPAAARKRAASRRKATVKKSASRSRRRSR